MKATSLLYGHRRSGAGPRPIVISLAEKRLAQALRIVALAGFSYKDQNGFASCGADLLHLGGKDNAEIRRDLLSKARAYYLCERDSNLGPAYASSTKALLTDKDEPLAETSENMALVYLDDDLQQEEAIVDALTALFHLGQTFDFSAEKIATLIEATYLADRDLWK